MRIRGVNVLGRLRFVGFMVGRLFLRVLVFLEYFVYWGMEGGLVLKF